MSRNNPKIPPKWVLDYIKNYVSYNPKTGDITKHSWLDAKGYRIFKVINVRLRVHHCAWFIMTGKWPHLQIDHKDENKLNNKWDNLQLITDSENQLKSSTKRKSNTSGYIGVAKHSVNKNWFWHLQVRYKTMRGYGYNCPTIAAVERDKFIVKNNIPAYRNIL